MDARIHFPLLDPTEFLPTDNWDLWAHASYRYLLDNGPNPMIFQTLMIVSVNFIGASKLTPALRWMNKRLW